jgi:hypothetical protein
MSSLRHFLFECHPTPTDSYHSTCLARLIFGPICSSQAFHSLYWPHAKTTWHEYLLTHDRMQGPGRVGYSPRTYTQTEQQILEQDIASSFVGAELCGCIKITQFLMAGGYGRGEFIRVLPPMATADSALPMSWSVLEFRSLAVKCGHR